MPTGSLLTPSTYGRGTPSEVGHGSGTMFLSVGQHPVSQPCCCQHRPPRITKALPYNKRRVTSAGSGEVERPGPELREWPFYCYLLLILLLFYCLLFRVYI